MATQLRYVTKPANRLTDHEYRMCMAATLRPASEMRYQLPRYRSKRGATIFMAFDGKELAAWAMAHERSMYYSGDCRAFYVYVKEPYRRKGIASRLFGRARMGLRRPIFIAPWNARSSWFFDNFYDGKRVRLISGYKFNG